MHGSSTERDHVGNIQPLILNQCKLLSREQVGRQLYLHLHLPHLDIQHVTVAAVG